MDEHEEELAAMESRVYGKYRGVVVENVDPDKMGRLQVSVENVLGAEKAWALPCVPYAGKGVGWLFLPEVGTNVWVEFEGGDIGQPIWTGCFWKPGEFEGEHAPHIKRIQTEKLSVEIDDERGSITIKNNYGTVFEISGNKITGKAAAKITHQVKTMKTTLDVTKFDVHDGAMSIS